MSEQGEYSPKSPESVTSGFIQKYKTATKTLVEEAKFVGYALPVFTASYVASLYLGNALGFDLQTMGISSLLPSAIFSYEYAKAKLAKKKDQ